ncbi:hypothetical protein PAL_GLEAN10003902 [Pteropus alecto]|uniref:Uncharacterized protein n=1 Tax=Pteropus alecto TaxID=9402 RepID=L5KXR9_PTEAL|nr:hypothetical protein PAL_GLEAN10003902 [Pteropus alecto]
MRQRACPQLRIGAYSAPVVVSYGAPRRSLAILKRSSRDGGALTGAPSGCEALSRSQTLTRVKDRRGDPQCKYLKRKQGP